MKIIVTLTALLFSIFTFSQTKIDDNVSVRFPSEPERFEESEIGRRIIDYVVENDTEYFIVEKFEYTSATYDNLTLKRTKKRLYKEFFESLMPEYLASGYVLTDSQTVTLQGKYALQFELESTMEDYYSKFQIVIIDEEFYAFGYTGPKSSVRNGTLFFESIKINPNAENNWSNFSKSQSFKFIAIIVSLAIIAGLIFIFRYRAKKFKEEEKIQV